MYRLSKSFMKSNETVVVRLLTVVVNNVTSFTIHEADPEEIPPEFAGSILMRSPISSGSKKAVRLHVSTADTVDNSATYMAAGQE